MQQRCRRLKRRVSKLSFNSVCRLPNKAPAIAPLLETDASTPTLAMPGDTAEGTGELRHGAELVSDIALPGASQAHVALSYEGSTGSQKGCVL